jgi:hypothetical protein
VFKDTCNFSGILPSSSCQVERKGALPTYTLVTSRKPVNGWCNTHFSREQAAIPGNDELISECKLGKCFCYQNVLREPLMARRATPRAALCFVLIA